LTNNNDIKEEIKLLIEIAEENLSASRLLFENKLYRDSIARAYYAIFHSAKALLLTKNLNPKKHAGIMKMFGLHFVNEGYIEEIYGKIMTKSYNLRWKADYTTDKPSKEMTESVLNDAELFVERIKRAIGEFYE
jgi:uncharacterized protein (UPF0332 family)